MGYRNRTCMLSLFAVLIGLQQSPAQHAKVQTTFCEDGGPDAFPLKADSLPKAVIDAVMNTNKVQQAQGDADETGKKPHPEEVLRATRIRLSVNEGKVFLVMSSSYSLAAANASWFWVVILMIGEFEYLLITAAARLGEDAYGAAIRREIEDATGKRCSIGALYTTLDRILVSVRSSPLVCSRV